VHPPLTDATIGTYTFATAAAVLSKLGIAEESAAKGWALALVVGLVVSAPTALTGLIDWLRIEGGTPLKRTATSHLIAMVSATVFFALAAIFGHGAYTHGNVSGGAYALTVIGFLLMTLGGWLGGAIVFVHGFRVLPAERATMGGDTPGEPRGAGQGPAVGPTTTSGR
jgi:uncharacterized membrane protein